MKQLELALPKNVKETTEKGFNGNISDFKKFITDEHSIMLTSAVSPGLVFKKDIFYTRTKPTLDSIQATWDRAASCEAVPAHFIGCGIIPSTERIVAVIRDDENRIAIVDPYILKLVLSSVSADAIAVSAGKDYATEPIALLRAEKFAAFVMLMRYGSRDLSDYDLTGPAVDLKLA